MKILQFNLYQCGGRGGDGAGRVRSKKSKPIPAPPHDAGLKSRPIPAPPPLQGEENPRGPKRGGAKLPSLFKTMKKINAISLILFFTILPTILAFHTIIWTVRQKKSQGQT